MKGDREMCLTAGMDSYVTKPIKVNHLVEVIQSAMGDRKTVSAALGEQPDRC
jgi:CheY-like chemotaxis protein